MFLALPGKPCSLLVHSPAPWAGPVSWLPLWQVGRISGPAWAATKAQATDQIIGPWSPTTPTLMPWTTQPWGMICASLSPSLHPWALVLRSTGAHWTSCGLHTRRPRTLPGLGLGSWGPQGMAPSWGPQDMTPSWGPKAGGLLRHLGEVWGKWAASRDKQLPGGPGHTQLPPHPQRTSPPQFPVCDQSELPPPGGAGWQIPTALEHASDQLWLLS